jgi:hypothetical protein
MATASTRRLGETPTKAVATRRLFDPIGFVTSSAGVNGRQHIWLNNAATTQPQSVIDRLRILRM